MSLLTDNQLIHHAGTYIANGNKLGVVLLQDNFGTTEFRKNSQLRQLLAKWGRQLEVDSVMVVHKPASTVIAADVFEPWGQDTNGLAGSWSSMCGNGMMAVALFYEEHIAPLGNDQSIRIHTQSGTREVTKLGAGRYSVCMGRFTNNSRDLMPYVHSENQPDRYVQQLIPSILPVGFSSHWNIGLSGNRNNGTIDGEPHVVLIGSDKMNRASLRQIAMEEGPKITKNLQLFPQEINANFAVVESPYSPENGLQVLACTHERGLGNDPGRSVTGACGTGATAIGATLYRTHSLADDSLVHISMPSGHLQVYRRKGEFYLVGSAKRMPMHTML